MTGKSNTPSPDEMNLILATRDGVEDEPPTVAGRWLI
jgi:hypothetical protein